MHVSQSIFSYYCYYIQVHLAQIWKTKPCYKFAAIIGKYKIHQSSFHTLKERQYLNDEVIKVSVMLGIIATI